MHCELPPIGSSSRPRPPDQRVATPLHVGGHPCEEPLARSRLRPCPPLHCSPQVAAAATATTPRPRQPAPRRAARSPFVGCNPENPLVPSNTTETCGGNVIDAVFAKLVHYDPETAKPENDIAESIETTDNQNFTVKLKQGYKFHDGTEVKAEELRRRLELRRLRPERPVERLLHGAHRGLRRPAVRRHREPRRPVRGLHPEGQGDDRPRRSSTTHTFTIKTTEKVSNLPVRLGYSAFAPLPGRVLRRPEGLRRQADRRRPVQARLLDQGAVDRPVEVRRLLAATSVATSTRSPSRSTRTPTPPTTTSSPTTSTSPTRSRRAP